MNFKVKSTAAAGLKVVAISWWQNFSQVRKIFPQTIRVPVNKSSKSAGASALLQNRGT